MKRIMVDEFRFFDGDENPVLAEAARGDGGVAEARIDVRAARVFLEFRVVDADGLKVAVGLIDFDDDGGGGFAVDGEKFCVFGEGELGLDSVERE